MSIRCGSIVASTHVLAHGNRHLGRIAARVRATLDCAMMSGKRKRLQTNVCHSPAGSPFFD
jgi:hypothetical protein